MPNRVRPRCPTCDKAMAPVFRKRIRGAGFDRIRDTFHCVRHGYLARGRRRVAFMPSRGAAPKGA